MRTVVVDGHVAGNVVSWVQGGERLVGYWIGREHWGKGVATAALSTFLRQVAIRPLVAYVAERNVASIRVLEKCGFRTTGSPEVGEDGVTEIVLRLDD
jgi:RimJ/RimL family protein N-acetyltransferase